MTVALVAVALVSLALAAQAPAAAPKLAPGWVVDSRPYPTQLQPGGVGVVEVDLFNTGAAAAEGNVTVVDKLPPGLTATKSGALTNFGQFNEAGIEEREAVEDAENAKGQAVGLGGELRTWSCSGTTKVTCTTRPGAGGILRPILSGSMLRLGIKVTVASSALGAEPNEVTVSGGHSELAERVEATPASSSDPLTVGSGTVGFGFDDADAWFTNADGTADTQAGSHPFEATFSFDLNQAEAKSAGGALRDLSVALPRGFVGNPSAVPECTREQFVSATQGGCPSSTQVGVDRPALPEAGSAPFTPVVAVYNLVPPPGIPAEFGFAAEGVNVLLDAQVRTGSDYGITEAVHTLSFEPVGNVITIWGVPAEPVHDVDRCGKLSVEEYETCGVRSGAPPEPFLTLPTACEGPLSTTLTADTWQNDLTAQTSYLSHDASGAPTGYTGCEGLGFAPTITVAPDTTQTETPAGLTVEVKAQQDGLLNPKSLATSNIKDTTVTLPEGVAINPGQARGLATCSQAQSAIGTEAEPSCPSAAKVGTDEIETPLLPHDLKGNVYVLDSTPPHLKLLVAASGEGVNLKLLGNVELNESTGRLTTTFSETPELPFTDFKLSFSGGAQAALYTPPRCGAYKTTSDFTPWSEPSVADVFPGSEFQINAGVGGGSCPSGALPFAPTLTAGSTTDQAGGFTDFSLLLTRPDGQQRISTLQFKTPEGLLGMISKVPLCPEPQAAQGTCSAASQIGHTTVEAGPGSAPLVIPEPGQAPAPIYLTGGYKGAPYGLSIAVPVLAGPFNLGTVVVRSAIAVDRRTAQLTITTDPLPSILDGVPTDLRTINAVVDRPDFMFNPTNCGSQSFSGTATSTEGASAPIASHFQMGSCRSLEFHPDFKVSTSAQSSKANGASLDAKIVYPTTPLGANQATSQSSIQSVKVDLPIQLPSRLTTLQKACLAKVFEENPAKCPKESLVGNATAITPVLPVPLNGPAYFVSHGGESFPSLIIILQGYGVTVELIGTTLIKNGITSSTFKQVPDVPITSFDLNLPEGHFSALGANLPESAKGSFCGQKLVMPTAFTGQNGAVIHQSTPIAIQGCSTKVSLAAHSLKGKTLTLSVYAPAAGKIKVSGKGLPSATKTAKGQENVTIKLQAKRAKAFKTKLKLSFQPSKGKGQRVAVAVRG